MKVGIDAGGTLIKIVQEQDNQRTFKTELTKNIDQVVEWLNQQQIEKLCLTGGNAGVIAENINIPAQIFVEFDAASRGLGILLKEQGHDLADYIFANVGIGTGGGMIQGLGYLLSQITDYKQLTDMAQYGDRNTIDLKVRHIYKDTEPPIPGDLTAANFGHVLHHLDADFTPSNKLAAVIGVVGEVVTTMAITVAREFKTENIVYIGSSFHNNALLRKVVERPFI